MSTEKPHASWAVAWDGLTAPRQAGGPTTNHRQSQLLASLLLITILCGGVFLLFQSMFGVASRLASMFVLPALMALTGAYILARRGQHVVGAVVATFTCIVGSLVVAVVRPDDQLVFSLLIVPIVLSALFLPMKLAVGLTVFAVSAMIATVVYGNGTAPATQDLVALGVITLNAVLLMLAANHRNLVERDRHRHIAESEQNLRALTESAGEGILVCRQGRCLFANARMRHMLGIVPSELATLDAHALLVGPESDTASRYETIIVAAGGRSLPVEVSVARTVWEGDNADLFSVRDVSERRNAEAQMRKLSRAVEATADAVMITDANGVIEYVNPSVERMTGYGRAELLGQTPRVVMSGKHGGQFFEKLWAAVSQGKVFSDVFVNKRKDGTLYYQEQSIAPVRDASGQIVNYVATGRDISERMMAHERLQYLAHHDLLTGLPNRVLFLDRLEQGLARARWHSRLVAVLFLDLDGFKHINDSLGHDIGDRLLVEVAQRLRGCVREGDTVARFGGDEFVLLLDDVATDVDISALAEKTLVSMRQPLVFSGHDLHLSASIGVSFYPNDGDDVLTMLKNADIAMYRAKESGKNNFQFFSAEMGTRAFERISLESQLRRALERDQFVLFYQPIIDLQSGHVVATEALLRWQHPESGLVFPGEFIPLLEETGLIESVGKWILRAAALQGMKWLKEGVSPNTRVAVNISRRQLSAPDFVQSVQDVLRETGLPPIMLELEITESMLMQNVDAGIATLHKLRGLGVRLSIDDFGTGYSSLSTLKRFPVQTLKIDQSFIHDVVSDRGDAAIVRAAISIAQGLEMDVIAEGVTRADQVDALRAMGCGEVQGYFFGMPARAEQLDFRPRSDQISLVVPQTRSA